MSDKQSFLEAMEQQFGSDEAIGVWFEVCETGERLSLTDLKGMTERLGDDMPDTASYLPNGGSAVCCTDYALLIHQNLPGRVQIFGFANEDNPTSRVAREEIHPGGHDFALVDGKYIVDPWLRLVPGVLEQMVFDLDDPADGALALDIYGPRSCWKDMSPVAVPAVQVAAPIPEENFAPVRRMKM